MNARLVGLDIGDKRIGVAVSDPLRITAQGLGMVERRSMAKDVAAILEMLNDYGDIESFVVGLPLLLDGTDSEQTDRTRHFAKRLRKDTGIPVLFQDERFSTAESERLLIDGGVRRSARKGVIDKLAATLILQAHMDGAPSAPLAEPE